MSMPVIKIGNSSVGGKNPVFIIAEIGINFDGDYKQALKLIDVAASAGCNAVKFQLIRADLMYAKEAGFYKTASGKKKDIIEIVKAAELSYEWIPKLRKYSNGKGMEFFSSVFDHKGIDFLIKNNVDAFKIASYEITSLPFFRHVATAKKPVIFSAGGATMKDIATAVQCLKENGATEIALNHCVGEYPTPLERTNLNVLKTLQSTFFDVVIGWSDHTSDPVIAPRAAVALGAKMVEKHITLDRNLPGPDHSFAINPDELKTMVEAIRGVEEELKRGKSVSVDERLLGFSAPVMHTDQKWLREFTYRTVFATRPIAKGEQFSSNNIAVLRPGKNKRGLEPEYYDLLVQGYRASRDISDNKAIKWDDVLGTLETKRKPPLC